MLFHTIARFTPKPGKADAFRKIMVHTAKFTRQEPDCHGIDLFETVREPQEFSLHSIWTDEEAFERHASLPHTEQFVEASKDLLTHEIKVLRLSQITID